MDFRSKILSGAYNLFPFPLKGDAEVGSSKPEVEVSCVINFYKRTDLLKGILCSLSEQNFPREKFEVILIEDRGGSKEGIDAVESFSNILNLKYHPLTRDYGKMGYSRNFGLSKARGRFVLFLDDDTIIMQRDFLSTLVSEFEDHTADAVVPYGSASFSILEGKYAFHDPHFPTNRCVAYRRTVLRQLGGFVSEIVGQEDVEFTARYFASGRQFHNSEKLCYMHPPLVYGNLNKATAVGSSFAGLRNRYPLAIWLMLLANGGRFLPLLLVPGKQQYKMQGRFSLGFLLGIFYSITGRKVEYN